MLTFQSFRARRPVGTLHPETALGKEEITSRSSKLDLYVACSGVDCPIVGHEHCPESWLKCSSKTMGRERSLGAPTVGREQSVTLTTSVAFRLIWSLSSRRYSCGWQAAWGDAAQVWSCDDGSD